MWWPAVFLGFILPWNVVLAQKTPTISYISPDVVSDIGGQVNLTCRIQDGREYPILWTRLEPTFPLSSGPALLISDKRFSLHHDNESGTYSLAIRDVRPTDAATYQCQVVVSLNNMVTDNVALNINLPPTMVETTPRSVRVESGKKAAMTCAAKGFPDPDIEWSREDKLPLPSGRDKVVTKVFTIDNVRQEDRGNYVCHAKNGVGEGQSRLVTLEVEFKPAIEIPRPRIPQALGYRTELECRILAFPPPSIIWRKGNASVDNVAGVSQIVHFAEQQDVIVSTLTLESVSESDIGEYSCEASNRHGSDKKSMQLYESNIAICPPVCGEIQLTAAAAGQRSFNRPLLMAALLAFTAGLKTLLE